MPYLTLDEIPSGRICRPLFIPEGSEWLALFGGALTELTKSWNFEQFGTLTPQEMSDACAEIIAAWYEDACGDCETPDGTPILTVFADGKVKELKDGEWLNPSGDYELPPLGPIDAPTAEERRCLAAKNLANVLEQVYEDMTDNYNLDADPYIALLSSAGTYSTVVLAALGFISLGLGTILFGTWTLMYQALEFLTEDVWDSSFTEKLVCVLFQVSQDDEGVVTFNWKSFVDRLAFQIDLGDPSLGELRLFAQILYMVQFIGVDGMNQAATTTAITDSDCEECGCEDVEWSHTFDFTIDEQGFEAIKGTYVSGTGWRNSYYESGSSTWRLQVGRACGMLCPSEIIGIEIYVSGTQEQARILGVNQHPTGVPSMDFVDFSGGSCPVPYGGEGTPFTASDAIGIALLMDNYTASSFTVTSIRVWGEGNEPDWSF